VTTQDIFFMQKALKLASENLGATFPNPSVGCVIVKNNEILSSATTAFAGRPHAEDLACAKLSPEQLEKATMYVTLEPCFHYGATPPCVDIIIRAKIKKVFIAIIDPDERVNGKSVVKLRQAGIEVHVGLLHEEAMAIYRPYIKRQQTQLPYVTLKIASSMDGKIALANGKSKWITGEKAREFVQELRIKNDAIIIGINTALKDDPTLNVRLEGQAQYNPIRIVLDKNLSLPINSKLCNSINLAPLWLVTTKDEFCDQAKILQDKGAKIIHVDAAGPYIKQALAKLGALKVSSLLVEGGGATFSAFLKAKMVDRLIWITANKIIGNDGIAAVGDCGYENLPMEEFKLDDCFAIDEDVVKIYHKITTCFL
jgi:diaminohydroxyphosphoribosylaminopyrimidine deaminase/5-amino-6-(5-phosphoribosylamino)uracil reductase